MKKGLEWTRTRNPAGETARPHQVRFSSVAEEVFRANVVVIISGGTVTQQMGEPTSSCHD
jgi:hypothetical protein